MYSVITESVYPLYSNSLMLVFAENAVINSKIMDFKINISGGFLYILSTRFSQYLSSLPLGIRDLLGH